jgi:hypothetical protein
MRMPGYLFMAAMIIPMTLASLLAAMAMDAVPASDTIICAATHQYQNQTITVRREFKLDGAEVTGSRQGSKLDSKRAEAGDDEIAARIRRQLFDYVTSMVKTRDKDCSPNNPDDGNEIHVFDCSENWQEGSSRFLVSSNLISWNYGEGTDWRLSMRWPNVGFLKAASNQTQLTVYVPSGWQSGAVSKQSMPVQRNKAKPQSVEMSAMPKRRARPVPIILPENWTKTQSVEVRVGDVTYTLKIAGAFDMPYNEWSKLMQASGDIEITVYGDKEGAVLKKTFPRSVYMGAEDKIKTGYRAMMEKARNTLTSCKRLDSWEGGADQMIVVT